MKKSESAEKYALFTSENQSKTTLNKYVGGFWCERQQEMDFFTGGIIIMDSYFDQKWQFKTV